MPARLAFPPERTIQYGQVGGNTDYHDAKYEAW